MTLDKKNILLSFTLILLLFTTLRNISILYYLFTFSLIFYFFVINFPKLFFFKKDIYPFLILIYFTFFLCGWSYVFSDLYVSFSVGSGEILNKEISIDPLIGIPRLLLMPIMSFVFLCILKDEQEFRFVIKVIFACFIFSCLFSFIQIIIGPFTFLADAHARGGYIKYPSLLGSLTVMGSILAYIVIGIFDKAFYRSYLIKLLLLFITLFAAVVSLTKTAVVLILIAFFLLLSISFIKNLKTFIKLLFLFLIITIILSILIINNDYLSNYVNTVINFTFGWTPFDTEYHLINDTPNITLDFIIYRLTWFSSSAIDYYGLSGLIFGVGVLGGGGVMGFPNQPSAHNGIVDLILIGGIIYLLLFLYFYIRVQYYFYKNIDYNLNKFFFLCNIVFLVNMIFISGSYFQPSISIIYWLSIPYYFYHKGINKV